jgi:DHA1 family tetracycline resistance protein-like MFS transporter
VLDEACPGGSDGRRLPGPLGWPGGRQTCRRYRSPPISRERAILPPILMIVFVDTLGYAAAVPLIPLVLSGQGAPLIAVGSVFAAFSLSDTPHRSSPGVLRLRMLQRATVPPEGGIPAYCTDAWSLGAGTYRAVPTEYSTPVQGGAISTHQGRGLRAEASGQLLTAPLLGRLSDRIGRRPVLALSLVGSAAGFALLALSSAFPIVLLSRIIDGCSAGNVAMCYAAVLDSDSEDKRRRGIPALGVAAGAGIVAGLGLSAFLAGFGFRTVALAAMLLSLLSLALTLDAVPETRHRTSPGLKVSAALRIRKVQRAVVFVALCAALQAAFLLTLPVYFSSALGLHVQATTALIAFIVVVAAAFQVAVLPRLLGRVGVTATAGVVMAVALCAAAFVGIIAGGAAAMVVLSAAVLTIAAALAPISTLFLAESFPDAPGGVAIGPNTSFATVGQIVGPLIGYAAFASGGSQALGLSCVALALCSAAMLGIGRWLKIERAPGR